MEIRLTDFEIKEAIAERLKKQGFKINYIPTDIKIQEAEFGYEAIAKVIEEFRKDI